ncbi:hypothetical protein CRG98_027341 [Punica granatum]|uniref:Uncharacterized protein n=1 Tax=Punica granatum TaxID=22663 RepID=A0A2I0J9A4_PUNGR|nr:hypothetical protein CRG98_027341 [Punica granatum]
MAPDEETAPQGAPGGLLMQDPRREKAEKWQRCMVERLWARSHLVTGESEGREEPLESDGTTRLSREMEKTSRKPEMHP